MVEDAERQADPNESDDERRLASDRTFLNLYRGGFVSTEQVMSGFDPEEDPECPDCGSTELEVLQYNGDSVRYVCEICGEEFWLPGEPEEV